MSETVKEPQVQDEVLAEIKKLNEDTETQYTQLRKDWKALETEYKSNSAGNETKIAKLEEAVTTRQAELDKTNNELNKRMDQIEVAIKRPSAISAPVSDADAKLARDFMISCMIAKKNLPSPEKLIGMEPDVEHFKRYSSLVETALRRGHEHGVFTPEQMKDLSVGIDSDGGYTVTPQMSSRIVQRIYESDPIRQLATVETISTDALELMVDWDEFGAGWEGETETGSKTTTADMGKKKISAWTQYAKPRATQNLLDDSAINIEQWISNKVADRFSRLEAAAFVTGDGRGKPRGFLTYDDGTNYGQIEQVAMGAASDVTADGFIDLKYALKEFYLDRGTFLMNRTTVRDTMKLKDGTGNYIWKPAFSADQPSTILSLPVRMSTTMPEIAANALSVALADWTTTYTIVDRMGIMVQRDPYTVKPLIEFYTTRRVGGDVTNYESIKIGKISA